MKFIRIQVEALIVRRTLVNASNNFFFFKCCQLNGYMLKYIFLFGVSDQTNWSQTKYTQPFNSTFTLILFLSFLISCLLSYYGSPGFHLLSNLFLRDPIKILPLISRSFSLSIRDLLRSLYYISSSSDLFWILCVFVFNLSIGI